MLIPKVVKIDNEKSPPKLFYSVRFGFFIRFYLQSMPQHSLDVFFFFLKMLPEIVRQRYDWLEGNGGKKEKKIMSTERRKEKNEIKQLTIRC